MQNELADAKSPYLRDHKSDRVNWRQWSDKVFEDARQLEKPILLFIGTASSHRCQVMQRENFQDPATAEILNESFLCVLVDREERPDLDALHQTAVRLFGAAGGSPLTMFLTADRIPFGGGTYFPPAPRAGLPAFSTVLAEILRLTQEGREQIGRNTLAVQDRWSQVFSRERPWEQPTGAALEMAARALCQEFDIFYGGLPGAPKAYAVPAIEMLWRAYARTATRQFSRAVELTLTGICQGGTYDHLGGGFVRQSRDELWFVPFFEKTLNDNAQLIELLARVSQGSANPLYGQRLDEAITWVQREMVLPNGAFASSLAAETAGIDGQFYTWTAQEIAEALGEDAGLFRQIYDVRADGNWEGRNILHRLGTARALDGAIEDKLRSARERLRLKRQEREKPRRDDKVLADWNGMMISALVVAAGTFERPDWQAAAIKAFWAVVDTMDTGGELAHCWFDGQKTVSGFAGDYAQMARAALALHEITGHTPYLERAIAWAQTLEKQFWLDPAGGYAMTVEHIGGGASRLRSIADGVTPSANSTMAEVLGRLFYLTREEDYAVRAQAVLQTFFQDAGEQRRAAAGYFNGLDFVLGGEQVVIIGSLTDPAALALRKVVTRLSFPSRVVSVVASAEALPSSHPARDKGQVNRRATAYICGARQCSEPITEPRSLELRLKTVQTKPLIVQ